MPIDTPFNIKTQKLHSMSNRHCWWIGHLQHMLEMAVHGRTETKKPPIRAAWLLVRLVGQLLSRQPIGR